MPRGTGDIFYCEPCDERDLEKKEEEARYRRYKDTFFRVLMLILVLFLVLLALHYFEVIELPWLKGLL